MTVLARATSWLIAFGTVLVWQLGWAQEPVPPLTGHVVDLTHTLTADQQASLEQALAAFELRKGSQLAVLLVETTRPEAIEQYSLRVAEQWKMGRKRIDDGVVLVVSKNDRAVRIEVGYGLEAVLSDAISKRIIENTLLPRFSQQDFAGGIAAGVADMMRIMDGESLPAATAGQVEDPVSLMTWIIATGVLLGFLLRRFLGRLPGAIMAASIVGAATWLLVGVLSMAMIAGGITLMTTWIGLSALLASRYGGRGDLGGGFRGGGGGFGGGGSSGRW